MKLEIPIDKETEKNLKDWLEGPYNEEVKNRIRHLMSTDSKELIDAFYCRMAFGTGGLRGLMGVGSNRINLYTIAFATQGLANYIKKTVKSKTLRVAISYDSRLMSHEFAKETAKILSANGIHTYLFKQLRPTPMVSFCCRLKKCHSAIMITASHNTQEYNGYKVYWDDGAQVLPPHDKGIIDEVNKITSPDQVKYTSDIPALIEEIGEEMDKAYTEAIIPLQSCQTQNKESGSKLSIIYTNLHGSGITMVPLGLSAWGFTNIKYVEEQKEPDGTFPTIISPNPEESAALLLGIQKLLENKADILFGTDADADRLGAVVRHNGKAVLLNGNQIASICLYHYCSSREKESSLDPKAAFIKTIVTTELFKTIAESFNRPCFNVLTGFKYIGELISKWEQDDSYHYKFGGEESYGYLLGTHIRDKDATVSAAILAEAALNMKLQEKTLVDLLEEIYIKYGVYREKLESITLKGKEGKLEIEKIMSNLRNNPPTQIGSLKVISYQDYQSSKHYFLSSKKIENIDLPKSNVLLFWLEDESKVVIRPSGTEPKIKFYIGAKQKVKGNISQSIAECDIYLDTLLKSLREAFQV